LREAEALQPVVPSTLQAELRDYQMDGFQWLARLAHWGVGACLADDMGLGKTVQALAVLLARAGDGPALVVAPTSVCLNWLDEIRRFAPTLNPIVFGAGDRAQTLDRLGPFDLLICSYGLLQQEAERLAGREWRTIVLDEAQAIKNMATKRSQAAMSLRGDFKMLATGTPIENHLGELWNLFRFINPGLLGSLERFNQRFATPVERDRDNAARHRLKQLIQPFILRRLKSEVLESLPPRTEILRRVELGPEESALYEALRQQALIRLAKVDDADQQKSFQILAEIMKLRRACCHPRLALPDTDLGGAKLAAFEEILDELLENRHQALVFSQFVDHLAILRELLDRKKVAYQYLDGSTPAAERKRRVDAFQAGRGDVFLISLKAGGLGLNLTAADYVIHMDPWWNPAVEDQASDRAHRIGQQRPVTIYRLVAQGTIEEKIVALHHQKRDLADRLLEGTGASGRISAEELLELLREAA
jgi:SNF2 family DNA or RNA helicase